MMEKEELMSMLAPMKRTTSGHSMRMENLSMQNPTGACPQMGAVTTLNNNDLAVYMQTCNEETY